MGCPQELKMPGGKSTSTTYFRYENIVQGCANDKGVLVLILEL